MKLPKKYQGITPGEWKAYATGISRSGLAEHEVHWSPDGECVAEIVHGEKEATIMADSPRLAAAVVMLRETIEMGAANRAYDAGLGVSEWPAFLTEAERKALDQTKEWES